MANQPDAPAFLVMRRGSDPNRRFSLEQGVITIGRSKDNDIVIEDSDLSRRHARLTWHERGWMLEDLGSTNGTFVDGQRISGPVMLAAGAQASLGPNVIVSLAAGGLEASRVVAHRPAARSGRGRRWYWPFAAIAVTVPVLLVMMAGALYLYASHRQKAQGEWDPPQVLVTEPVSGVSLPSGAYLSVAATALGRSPITRAELWLDGELEETRDSTDPAGVPIFYAGFNLPVSEGAHVLFVRAVNTVGVTGQSLPVSVICGPALSPDQAAALVPVGPGETLADIAASTGADVATLQNLNPDLANSQPLHGAWLQAPIAPDKPSPAANSPSPIPASGSGLQLPAPGSGPVAIPDVPPLESKKPAAIDWGIPLLVVSGIANPPAAPGDLQAQAQDCQVTLTWKDNAVNESSYEVWMAGLGSSPRRIASLAPAASSAAWFKFPAPQPGALSFWVEAVGPLGRQPSNIVWVAVDPKCPTTLTNQLRIDALDMTLNGGYDRSYCYLSFEGAPEVRLPADPKGFIQVQSGQGDVASWAGGSKTIAVPLPADDRLDLSGECWGWSGKSLDNLGSFSTKFLAETWDGARRSLQGDNFEIGIAIRLAGAVDLTGTLQTYGYNDPSLPVPYGVGESGFKAAWGANNPLERFVSWKWDGDEQTITGFMIYLNNLAYMAVYNPKSRGERLVIPHSCGEHIRWQVVAMTDQAESSLSGPFEYDQAKCQVYAMVQFNTLKLDWTVDGWGSGPGHCDNLDIYYFIRANDRTKAFWGWPKAEYKAPWDWTSPFMFFANIKCGEYTFKTLAGPTSDPYPDTILVKFSGGKIYLRVETFFKEHDNVFGDDIFGSHIIEHSFPSLQAAQASLGCGKSFENGPSETGTAASHLTYSVTVFPNECRDAPPPDLATH